MAGIGRELTIRSLYEKFMAAKEEDPETRFITCERCTHLVTPRPAGVGERRVREHPRTRFKVRPDFPEGGRTVENVAVLCGTCVESYRVQKGPFTLLSAYKAWMEDYAADVAREAKKEEELAEMQRTLMEDTISAGKMQSEGLNRVRDMEIEVPPEAIEDFDMDDVLNTARGEDKEKDIDEY
jgi:hypothetical protein